MFINNKVKGFHAKTSKHALILKSILNAVNYKTNQWIIQSKCQDGITEHRKQPAIKMTVIYSICVNEILTPTIKQHGCWPASDGEGLQVAWNEAAGTTLNCKGEIFSLKKAKMLVIMKYSISLVADGTEQKHVLHWVQHSEDFKPDTETHQCTEQRTKENISSLWLWFCEL